MEVMRSTDSTLARTARRLRELGVKGDYVGVGHLIVGYSDGAEPEAKPRRDGRVFRV